MKVAYYALRAACAAGLLITTVNAPNVLAQSDSRVEQIEQRRIDLAKKITPATIAIFDGKGEGGGSGVIISPDGFALTNFHVVAPCGPAMKCGLADGRLVDAVLVGLDPTGDIALVQLQGDETFPVAEFGNSDNVAVGDEAIVAGNPFLLADDFRPTITYGLISGTHRYQYPAGTVLEYADCLQTDASINPGNSGGPLYDGTGRLIGINGRASFEKRGRVNVGVGYAISINQVLRFVSLLKSGRIVDHASLGATTRTTSDRRVLIDDIEETSDAYRRGLRYGDQIIRIAGRDVFAANSLLNIVATMPAHWRVPIAYQRGDETFTAIVRLLPKHRGGELEEVVASQLAPLPKSDAKKSGDAGDDLGELAKVLSQYQARPGYANYFFNKAGRHRLLENCPQRTSKKKATWQLAAVDAGGGEIACSLTDSRSEFTSPRGRFWVDARQPLANQTAPPRSRGMLVALQLWRALLAEGRAAVPGLYYHGKLPWGDQQTPHECLIGEIDGVRVEFYFAAETANLVGVELFLDSEQDSCQLHFSDFRLGPQETLPARIEVSSGDSFRLDLDLTAVSLSKPNDASEGANQ